MDTEHLDVVEERLDAVCRITTPATWFHDLRRHVLAAGLTTAIAKHNSACLFDWLANVLAFQGVSNSIAAAYIDQYGTIRFGDVATTLIAGPSCPKLTSYWHFHDCRFTKVSYTCAEPGHIRACPLPTHDLRNGRLNQAAYALFLFVRDVCGGDLVGWLDERLTLAAAEVDAPQRGGNMRRAVLDPLTNVFGVSTKVVSLALVGDGRADGGRGHPTARLRVPARHARGEPIRRPAGYRRPASVGRGPR